MQMKVRGDRGTERMLSIRWYADPIVTCSTDLTIKLWDTGNEYTNVKTLHGHDHSVSAVRFTPDGDMLVSASRDKTIRVWEVASG